MTEASNVFMLPPVPLSLLAHSPTPCPGSLSEWLHRAHSRCLGSQLAAPPHSSRSVPTP